MVLVDELRKLGTAVIYSAQKGNFRAELGIEDKGTVSIVSHAYSYGGKKGLYEVWKLWEDDPIGWLTEEDVISYIKEG